MKDELVSDGQRPLFSTPSGRKEIVSALANYLARECSSNIDTIVSSSTQSLFVSSLLAQQLSRPLTYARHQAKRHGLLKQVEGKIRRGDKVLLVSSGRSTVETLAGCVGAVEGLEGKIVFCLLVDQAECSSCLDWLRHRKIPYGVVPDTAVLLPEEARPQPSRLANGYAAGSAERRQKNKERVANALLDVGAVTINRQKPFRYASGLLSPIYTDCRLLMSNPGAWSVVIDSFVDQIRSEVDPTNIDVIDGMATAGIPHASLIADRVNLPLAFVTFDDSEAPPVGRIDGEIRAGDRVVMIEDHVSTGSSVLATAAVLRGAGATVNWCFAIFTYSTPLAQGNFAAEKIELRTLCDIGTLLEVAMDSGRIGPNDKEAVESWLRDPRLWTAEESAKQNQSNTVAPR